MPSNPQQTIYSSFLVFIYILYSYIIADRSKFCWYRKCYVYRLRMHVYAVSVKSNVYNLYAFQLFPFDMCLWFNTNFLFDLIFFVSIRICMPHTFTQLCSDHYIKSVFNMRATQHKNNNFHSISLNAMEYHECRTEWLRKCSPVVLELKIDWKLVHHPLCFIAMDVGDLSLLLACNYVSLR